MVVRQAEVEEMAVVIRKLVGVKLGEWENLSMFGLNFLCMNPPLKGCSIYGTEIQINGGKVCPTKGAFLSPLSELSLA